jgi:hypothetical protein
MFGTLSYCRKCGTMNDIFFEGLCRGCVKYCIGLWEGLRASGNVKFVEKEKK